MKKIIAFSAATAAVIAVAIGVQATAGSGHDEEGQRPPAVNSTETPAPSDGEREGFTEDHEGKPGESK